MICNFTSMRTFRALAIVAAIMVFALGSNLAFAQSTTTGAIYGTAFDSSGAVLPNAKVDVRNAATNATVSTTSDDAGLFRVTNLQPGPYEVKVSAPNFAEFRGTLRVEVG